MARFKHLTSCPACPSSDACAVYDDGSKFCFSCKAFFPGDLDGKLQVYVSRRVSTNTPSDGADESSTKGRLPEGSSTISREGVEWLSTYGIEIPEALSRGLRWREETQQLLFPLRNETGRMVCVQARNFGAYWAGKAKYLNYGSREEALEIYQTPGKQSNQLVLTEDACSAIKVSRQCPAMPVLGVSLSKNKLLRIQRLGYTSLVVWLDRDKWKEAREIADMAKWLGLSATSVLTDLDPKEYSDKEIERFLS
jgi:hypothetical protein